MAPNDARRTSTIITDAENPQDDSILFTTNSSDEIGRSYSYHEMHPMDHADIERTYDGLAQKVRGMVAERRRHRNKGEGAASPVHKEAIPHEQLWVAVAGGPGSGTCVVVILVRGVGCVSFSLYIRRITTSPSSYKWNAHNVSHQFCNVLFIYLRRQIDRG